MTAWLILREIAATIRGIQTPHLPAVSLPQGAAKHLVAAAALLFIALPTAPAPQIAHADPGPVATDTTPPTAPADIHTPRSPAMNQAEVVVGPGDTLWRYAKTYLGDGTRWPEIYQANRGVPQTDGASLTHPDLILDGWHLTIPTGSPIPTPPTATATMQEVIVGPGDTLWGYAKTYLGDGNRWPEIYHANQGLPQEEGGALTNPDLILDGWHLTIPTGSPTPTPTTHDTQPATPTPAPPTPLPLAGDDTPPGPDSATPTSLSGQEPTQNPPAVVIPPTPPLASPSPTPIVTAVPTTAEPPVVGENAEGVGESESSPVWQVAGLAGAGLFLGAGVFAVLRRRRRDQFRHRQPGLMITIPDPIVAPIEMTATLAADLSARLLARIDDVLRITVATLIDVPEISAVGVGGDGTITLHTSTELPEPWQPVSGGCSLPAGTTPEPVGPRNPGTPAPYPLLVTIGVDDTGTTWLLNLEHQGTLTVGGDEVMRDDFLRYVAAELAVNPWSRDVRIACLGIAAETLPMAPDKFDATDERVTALATSNVERASRSRTTAATGRLHQLEDEAWPAVAAMIAANTTAAQELQHLIEVHPHRSGAALLRCTTIGDLNLTTGGRLTGYGFDLVPVGLTADEAAGCAALLRAANDTGPGQPAQPADTITDKTGNLLPSTSVDRNDNHTPAAEPILAAPDVEYIEVAPVTPVDLQLLAPRVRDGIADQLLAADPGLDRDVAAWFSSRCPQPRLTWLGPVTARCHGTPPAKSKGYYVEVLSFLAAHPNGVTNDQLVEAFTITRERVHTIISNLRQWVGVNPATQQPHIPEAKGSLQAAARGVGLYLVESLLVDADLFRRLRTRAHAKGADGIQDLETALTLVTGRPFDQLRPTGWSWLAHGDRIDHHMTCAIGDVAHTLVTHHLHAGDLPAARKAAEAGLTVCPESETACMDLAHIMVNEGNTQAAHQLLTDALADGSEGDPIDPSDRASQIFLNKHFRQTA
ncbi:LysM peptidoglycan-binding domain-containing protein [Tessaracoccus antarcticus]|uniref:LysM peptidoglycan-binding domain-containing protein n=2 Tax=Tessaracoccus antarcticus TaxID=2479848 RepID=A0A3M0FW90_9ACTN|nr:LysM peptidoglycan-binding domain-containing protein [Tessaracoccus antarcticus]